MSTKVQLLTLLPSLDGLTSSGNNPTSNPPAAQLFDGSFTSAAGPTTVYSVPVRVEQADFYRLHFTCPATGTPVGNLALQACLDPVGNAGIPSSLLVNWVPISFVVNGASSSSFAVNGATTISLDENRCNYPWVRAVLTLTSGTCAPTMRMQHKGMV